MFLTDDTGLQLLFVFAASLVTTLVSNFSHQPKWQISSSILDLKLLAVLASFHFEKIPY